MNSLSMTCIMTWVGLISNKDWFDCEMGWLDCDMAWLDCNRICMTCIAAI